jgi:putative solute:sodium symporter small subunit
MRLTARHAEYWRKTLALTAVLLVTWFTTTFVASWYARELNEFFIIGPLGYYLAAQGTLIVYVLIVWLYARRMNALDRRYGVEEGEED